MSRAEPFVTPFGRFDLHRYPLRRKETLRAWDSADAYLLEELAEPVGRILILNDAFGALALALSAFRPMVQTDSYIGAWSLRENLRTNGISETSVNLLDSLQPLQGSYDLVLIRPGKNLAMLEYQLIFLKPHLHKESRVIGGVMARHLNRSMMDLFERIIGPSHASLAWKKARLIQATPDLSLELPDSPYPTCFTLEERGWRICNHANVFSRERLDIGTRFFLQQLPKEGDFREIVDLGCGNGVVGLAAASRFPSSRVHFLDESAMAVASARATWKSNGLSNPVTFRQGDCLDGIEAAGVDLVLCNPPFHQQQVVGDAVAWRMFSQSSRALRRDGELWVVGNRHLGYHVKLKRIFGNCEQVAANPKFVILRCRRTGR